MYSEHVPIINAAMREDVDTFARGVMFAVLSARVQFPRVPEQMKELRAQGLAAECLWAWKYDAYVYLHEHLNQLWGETCAAVTPEEGLHVLCRIPGLGIVKGAFVLQMLGHDVACLDTRNIMREGLDPNAYKSRKKCGMLTPAYSIKISQYVRQTGGRAHELWDTWCADVADIYASDAETISRWHLEAIVPKRLRGLSPVQPRRINDEIPF